MPLRARPMVLRLGLVLAVGVVLALVAGCSTNGGGDRRPGNPVTEDEARMLAELLHRNHQRGGADFLVTAPYGAAALLTLTGEVDFSSGLGRAQAVTDYADGREDQTRTVFFTADELWFGDVPGLAEFLASAGVPDAAYLRRPMTAENGAHGGTGADGEPAALVDVLARLVLNLSADSADDARAFLERDYTYAGQRRIDGRPATVYAFGSGESVAVDAAEGLLVQYRTRLADPGFEVTVTLSDHGERQIDPPDDGQTVDAAEHPEIAAHIGL